MSAMRGLFMALAMVGATGFVLGTGQEAQALIKVPSLKIKVAPGHHYHVEYRNPTANEKVFEGFGAHAKAHAFQERMRDLGFQTSLQHHGSHFHVRYSLMSWRQKTFMDHGAAHSFENWLQDLGCQTKLVHH